MTSRGWAFRLGPPAAILALCAAAASAQPAPAGSPGPWQVSVFGGGWNAGIAPYVFKSPAFTADVSFGNAPCYGVSVGRDVSPLVGIEVAWTQTHPEQQFVGSPSGSPPTPIRELTLDVIELDSLWYFSRGTFRGYGLFGLGGANTGSSFGGANLAVTVGLGVKAFVDRHFAVRGDVRFTEMYGNIGRAGDAAFCDSSGCYYYRQSWYSSFTVTAGLTYAF